MFPKKPKRSCPPPTTPSLSWRERLSPSYAMRSLCALGAFGVVLLGAAPMAVASTNSQADPIIAKAVAGSPDFVDTPVSVFRLTDQFGRSVSLASFRGRVVVLTFLDPVCTSDCPLIAQEMRAADQMLGKTALEGRVHLCRREPCLSLRRRRPGVRSSGIAHAPHELALSHGIGLAVDGGVERLRHPSVG